MTKNKLKPIDVSKYTVTDTGQVLKMNKEVEVIQRPTYAELEEKISILLSCKNCPNNKCGLLCQKEYEDKCLAQKIQYIKELKEENAELKGLKDVATLIKANNDTVTTLMQLNNMLVGKNQQLTKAKEIIKTFLGFAEAFGYSPSMDKFITEVKDFLKE